MKKLLFVFNPYAGKAQIKNHLVDIIDTFNKADYEVTAFATQYSKHAFELVKEKAKNYGLVVCSGGDGTLNEVVSALMSLKNRPLLGYIPAGSTNDFASSLGLPKNMNNAAKAIVNGEKFLVDIGVFNNSFFTYVAAFGAFTEVTYMTPQQTKNILGHQAYILEGAKRLSSIKPIHMVVTYDGTVIEDDFLFGMITNATSVGGFKGFPGKNVGLNDGIFEVTLVRNPKSPLELPAIITSLVLRDPNPDYIYVFKTANINFKAQVSVDWVLDGEFGGSVTDVNISNCHQAIEIMVKNILCLGKQLTALPNMR